eukprot:scaffold9608_cov119-Skeletonema_dohrnii-CCMP3373.AAC.1
MRGSAGQCFLATKEDHHARISSCKSSAAAQTNLEAGILDSCVRSRKLLTYVYFCSAVIVNWST